MGRDLLKGLSQNFYNIKQNPGRETDYKIPGTKKPPTGLSPLEAILRSALSLN